MARGDRAALATAFDRHAAVLTRGAWGLAATPDAARSLVQDAFLQLWDHATDVRLASASLLPWLLAACAGRASGALPGDPLRFVRSDLAGASSDDRALCERCVVDGRSYAQAADELGLLPSAPGRSSRPGRGPRKAVTRDGH
ncbi:sigma-70 family RNA polymerase sigma factor [Curtobacterium sp. SGAir0471]|nr:sigma-70 family RNA polymerase sigma factor [Curtobacterium sp. SGAir0471]